MVRNICPRRGDWCDDRRVSHYLRCSRCDRPGNSFSHCFMTKMRKIVKATAEQNPILFLMFYASAVRRSLRMQNGKSFANRRTSVGNMTNGCALRVWMVQNQTRHFKFQIWCVMSLYQYDNSRWLITYHISMHFIKFILLLSFLNASSNKFGFRFCCGKVVLVNLSGCLPDKWGSLKGCNHYCDKHGWNPVWGDKEAKACYFVTAACFSVPNYFEFSDFNELSSPRFSRERFKNN